MRVQRVYIWCRSRNRCRVSVNLINLQRNCNSKNVKLKMGKEWKAKKKVIIVAKAIHQTMTAFFTRTTQGFENEIEIFPFLKFFASNFSLEKRETNNNLPFFLNWDSSYRFWMASFGKVYFSNYFEQAILFLKIKKLFLIFNWIEYITSETTINYSNEIMINIQINKFKFIAWNKRLNKRNFLSACYIKMINIYFKSPPCLLCNVSIPSCVSNSFRR